MEWQVETTSIPPPVDGVCCATGEIRCTHSTSDYLGRQISMECFCCGDSGRFVHPFGWNWGNYLCLSILFSGRFCTVTVQRFVLV